MTEPPGRLRRSCSATPRGWPFDNHYNAMNGQFVPLDADRALYVFGQFDTAGDVHRILALDLVLD